MTFCKGNTVVFYIIPAASGDLLDFKRRSHQVCYHGFPEEITITDTGQCAAAFFCQCIQLCGKCR